LHRSMRQLRQWPSATNPDETHRMAWTLRRGGETLAEIEMLEFGGETYRAAFREDSVPESRRKAVNELLDYLKGADFIVTLVSLAHVFEDPASVDADGFARSVEAEWATRNLIKFIAKELPPNVKMVIGLTQADRFADRLAAVGGPAEALAEYWPGVRAAAPEVPVLAVASVSATDSAGLPVEGYSTDGILPVMREFSRHAFGDPMALEVGARSRNKPVQDGEKPVARHGSGMVRNLLLVAFALAAVCAVHRSFDKRAERELEKTDTVVSTNAPAVEAEAAKLDFEKDMAGLMSALDAEDVEKARRLLEKIEASGRTTPDDKKKVSAARKSCSILERAFDGEAAAQAELAEAYYGGMALIKKNIPRAHLWFTIAANSGYAKAQLALAVMYEEGQGVRADAAEARSWYRKAAEGGEADAMYRVGVDSYSTNATAQEKAEANRWFRRAKKAGSRIPNLDDWIKITDAAGENGGN